MKQARFLFPFTHGMHASALEQAVLFARNQNAILVPVSLVRIPKDQQSKGPRLEDVQQSKDFLEAVRHKAQKCHVPVEQVEVLTSDIVRSIEELAKERECEGVLLFVCGKHGVLLDTQDVKCVMERTTCRLYVFHLESKDNVRLHMC